MTTISIERIAIEAIPDRELLKRLVRVADHERYLTADLLTLLGECDARRLYLGEGCSSLFTYCTQVLHFSEHAAYHRIEATRAARQFPVILELVADGSVTLTTVALLRPHLTPDNHRGLLTAARHRTKREVEHQIACLAPKPHAKALIRRLRAPASALTPTPAGAPTPALAPAPVLTPTPALTPSPVSAPEPAPALAPTPALAPGPVPAPGPSPAPTPAQALTPTPPLAPSPTLTSARMPGSGDNNSAVSRPLADAPLEAGTVGGEVLLDDTRPLAMPTSAQGPTSTLGSLGGDAAAPELSAGGLAPIATAVDIPRLTAELRPQLTPLAADWYLLRVTLSAETHGKLRRAQQLMAHRVPDGDPHAIIGRALSLLVEHLERVKFANVRRPRAGLTDMAAAFSTPASPGTSGPASTSESASASAGGSRRIPAAMRRQVWARDEGRCAFVGSRGRCTETARLEFHHLVPFARGGPTSLGNLGLRCRAHNIYESDLAFGAQVQGLGQEVTQAT